MSDNPFEAPAATREDAPAGLVGPGELARRSIELIAGAPAIVAVVALVNVAFSLWNQAELGEGPAAGFATSMLLRMVLGFVSYPVYLAAFLTAERPAPRVPWWLVYAQRLVPGAVAMLFVVLLGYGGLMLFIVPGFVLFLRYAFVVPIVLEGRAGISAAFSASHQLSRGRAWAVAGRLTFSLLPSILLLVFNLVRLRTGARAAFEVPIYQMLFASVLSVWQLAYFVVLYRALQTSVEPDT